MDNLLDQVIRSAIMSQYVFSRIQFDNAKDTQSMLNASNENHEMLVVAVLQRVQPRVEEMLLERLKRDINKGEIFMKVGDKLYEINPVEA